MDRSLVGAPRFAGREYRSDEEFPIRVLHRFKLSVLVASFSFVLRRQCVVPVVQTQVKQLLVRRMCKTCGLLDNTRVTVVNSETERDADLSKLQRASLG